MGGTTTELENLKIALEALKAACNDSILLIEADRWSDVKDVIANLIKDVETAIADYPTSYGSNMESIENKLPS